MIALMADLQNPTNEVDFIDKVVAEKHKADVAELKTDWRHEAWIDFRALNGTIIAYDENANPDPKTGIPRGGETVQKMTIGELAKKLGVSRDTLYAWEEQIPDFWAKVRARQKEKASQRRLSHMNDKFYIHAMTWKNWDISKTWLQQNNPDWRDLKQTVEHEMGNSMAELMKQLQAEKQAEQKTYVDAEVVSRETQQPDNA